MNPTTNMLKTLIAAAAFAAAIGLPARRAVAMPPAPLPGEIWVYPTGVFPDDFYALWLAVNGVPYAAGDLPYPYHAVPDPDPAARPVFVGKAQDGHNWTVVLKAHRLEKTATGYTDGPCTAFNLGLAAGTQLIKKDPVPPVMYMLTTDEDRFSTGFGELMLRRSVEIRGEMTPSGEEQFFVYTPNFNPLTNPETNPAFDAKWLPADYPRGSEYAGNDAYGVRSDRSVVYGGLDGFHVFLANVNLSVSDCLLYGQYAGAVDNRTGPNDVQLRNVDIRHTYHGHGMRDGKNISMEAYAIVFKNVAGSGGKRVVEGCSIDQSPTWQEYYFQANPNQYAYRVQACPEGHAILIWGQEKAAEDDFVRIEDCRITNCGKQCVIHEYSSVDLHLANCTIDGGYFPVPAHKDAGLADWWGTCVAIIGPTVDLWGRSPVIEVVQNDLIARGLNGWGALLLGCGNGEVTIADNRIICAAARPGYAAGIWLYPLAGVGSNGNMIRDNKIEGTGGWAINVDAYSAPCVGNSFVNNNLSDFIAPQPEVVFFGPYAQDNYLSGSGDVGVMDLGTGNIVEP
jgi:hypothetical protein